jgi:hypothetical protein
MVKVLDPRYSLPSRKYFSDTEIPRLYNELKESVVKPAIQMAEYVTATTDLWTSSAKHPYLSFTVHFITNDWDMRSYCLDTVPLFEDHTGQNLAEAVQDILANWELTSERLVCTTINNGSNFVSAFDTLDWPRLSCFGHNLDLAVNKALDIQRIQQAIGRCYSLVEIFNRSWKKYRDLRQKQVDLGLKQKLVSDVVTRWGSTYEMIARILEQQQAICAVLVEDRKSWHRMPSDSDFTILESVAAVLQPLHVLTDALAGEKHVTVSAIRLLLKHTVEEVLAAQSDDCEIAKEMKEMVADKLQSKYIPQNASELLDKCTFLDPRFKADYLADQDRTLSQLQSEALEIAETIAVEEVGIVDTREESESENPPVPKKLKGLGAVLRNFCKEKRNESLSAIERVEEKSTYLGLPTLGVEDDPLKWWKAEARRLPLLATLARKYLCICGTSVPSERLFSKAGYISGGLRARLSPVNVNRLVFFIQEHVNVIFFVT